MSVPMQPASWAALILRPRNTAPYLDRYEVSTNTLVSLTRGHGPNDGDRSSEIDTSGDEVVEVLLAAVVDVDSLALF